MHDFSQLDNDQMVKFLVEHIQEFTDEPSPDFPRNIQLGLVGGHLVIIKRESAFAVVARNCEVSYRPPHAELVFLYTDPAKRGRGEAGSIIEQIKADPVIGVPIRLLCCGEDRRRLFERHGFAVIGNEDDPYEMFYNPAAGR